jgi:hypothetical protein
MGMNNHAEQNVCACVRVRVFCFFFNVLIEHAALLSVVLHAVSIIYMCFTFFWLVLLFVT